MGIKLYNNMSVMVDSQSRYISYSLEEILRIASSGSSFEVTSDVIAKINDLSNKVCAPTYNKTPIFTKGRDDTKLKKKKSKNVEINDSDWEVIRTFQATEREQKEGIDMIIDNIRGELNKLSDKNYDKLSEKIKTLLKELVDTSDVTKEHKEYVANLLFEIATTNKFYSSIYAKLYKELIVDYSFVEDAFQSKFTTFIQLFKTINYVNPDVDYNLYCKINKENESRRALSMFIVNMVKLDVLPCDYLITIISELLTLTKTKMVTENCKEQVDELSENIYTLITESLPFIKTHAYMGSIMEYIQDMKSRKANSQPSLSSKSVFKHMDINDYIQKNK